MKFRLEWLGQYLPGELPDLATLRRRLTDVGFIVEGTEGEGRDAVLEVELTANRPDGMNHRGLAREAACALGREFRDAARTGARRRARSTRPRSRRSRSRSRPSARATRRGSSRGSGSARPPRRSRSASAALGMNPISAPVDATNHVLWDIGQPTPRLRPRHAREGPGRAPRDRRAAGAGRRDARHARRGRADALAGAPRHRRRREARRPRGRHGRPPHRDHAVDDARPPRVGPLQRHGGEEDGPAPRDAHRRLAPLRARDRPGDDGRGAEPGYGAPRRRLRRDRRAGRDRRPRARDPAEGRDAPPRAPRLVPRDGRSARPLRRDPLRPRLRGRRRRSRESSR